jgi:hypothetical protein
MKIVTLFLIVTFQVTLVAQLPLKPKKIATLHPDLHEISGLACFNDSVFIAINDGGNQPIVYFLTNKGDVFHTVKITNHPNNDWEAIAFDAQKQIVYIGDIGNNLNKRRDFQIIYFSTDSIFYKNEIEANAIHFQYPEQKNFPALDTEKYYDAEALAFHNDSLFIFTKCRTKPFDGISKVYVLNTVEQHQQAIMKQDLFIGKKGFLRDAITAAEFSSNQSILLSYSKIFNLNYGDFKFTIHSKRKFFRLTQKEAICMDSKQKIFIADEKHRILGGGKLYFIKNKFK